MTLFVYFLIVEATYKLNYAIIKIEVIYTALLSTL